MNIPLLLSSSILATCLLVSCSSNLSTSEPVASSNSRATTKSKVIAETIFKRVNIERQKIGKKALHGNSGLNNLAQKQANYLSKNSKTGEASTFGSNNRAQYAKLRYNIENVTELTNSTYSDNVASDIVQQWMGSPEHRRTLLQSWNKTGIGVSQGPYGRTYVTMLVGASTTGVPRSVTPVGWR